MICTVCSILKPEGYRGIPSSRYYETPQMAIQQGSEWNGFSRSRSAFVPERFSKSIPVPILFRTDFLIPNSFLNSIPVPRSFPELIFLSGTKSVPFRTLAIQR